MFHGNPINNHILHYRHQIQHYTGQLAKDTSKSLKDLGAISLQSSEQVFLISLCRQNHPLKLAILYLEGLQTPTRKAFE